jgi:hypothetical protein
VERKAGRERGKLWGRKERKNIGGYNAGKMRTTQEEYKVGD